MSIQTVLTCRVVDGNQALPLLDCERFGGVDAEADGLTLRVEGIEVDVSNYTERAVGGRVGKCGELFVREAASFLAPSVWRDGR